MSKMRTIEIDLDIHKVIEAERRSFDEPEYIALRRILKLGAPQGAKSGNGPTAPSNNGAWSGKGVTLPAGTEFRMEYRGKEHRGIIDNSDWVVGGKRFKSPSAAAGGVAETKSGTSPSLDGWKYWQVKRPGDANWMGLSVLRRRAA
jgi:hypothetical protein